MGHNIALNDPQTGDILTMPEPFIDGGTFTVRRREVAP